MPYIYKSIGNGELRTREDCLISRAFTRIVHGGRGAYVEFDSNDVEISNLRIPQDEIWRILEDSAYYVHFVTVDGVKVYYQRRFVDYADYKIGMWYVSPMTLRDFVRDGKYV